MKIEFEDIRNIIENQYDLDEVKNGLLKLDEVREAVRKELLKLPAENLLRRESESRWNVEIIRHLMLSEDDRINHWILGNQKEPTALGMPPDFLVNDERYRNVGKTPANDIEAVFAEWDGIHKTFTEYIGSITQDDLKTDTSERDFGQGDVGTIIQRMIGHELNHYDSMNKLLGMEEEL